MSTIRCSEIIHNNIQCCRFGVPNHNNHYYCFHHKPDGYVKHVNIPEILTTDERYKDGKIYKLFHIDEPNMIYIGQTITSLKCRLNGHKSSNSLGHHHLKKNKHFNYHGWKGVVIELIKLAPCNNKTELTAIEAKCIIELQPRVYYIPDIQSCISIICRQ